MLSALQSKQIAFTKAGFVLHSEKRGYLGKYYTLGGATRALALERLRFAQTDALIYSNTPKGLKLHVS